MKPLFLDNLVNLLAVDFVFLNKIILLSFVLLFFAAVLVLHRTVSRNIPVAKAAGTAELAIVGLLMLIARWRIGAGPGYGRVFETVGSILVMVCLANLAAYAVIDIYIARRTRNKFPSFSRDLVTLLIYVAFAIVSLRVIFRIDVTSILTTTTVLTAAAAFAMQSTLASIASGFSIQNEKSFRQGTWISVKEKDVAGEIVNVGFRYTTLRTINGTQIMIPNSMLLQSVVANYGGAGRGDASPVVLKVGLGYEVPPDRGKEILAGVLRAEREIAAAPPPLVQVAAFQASCIEYMLRFHVEDFARKNVLTDSVLRHAWYAVRREGHDFPYPRLELFPAPPPAETHASEGEVLDGLRSAGIFESFSDEEFAWLAKRLSARLYGTGEAVVRQGDAGDSLFIVRRGTLHVLVDDALVGSLGEGSVFGEMSLLTGQARSASVVAAAEALLIEVRKEHIGPVLKRNAHLLDALSDLLARRQEEIVDHRRKLELAEAGARSTFFLEKLKSFFGM